jgi:hypothetical protein
MSYSSLVFMAVVGPTPVIDDSRSYAQKNSFRKTDRTIATPMRDGIKAAGTDDGNAMQPMGSTRLDDNASNSRFTWRARSRYLSEDVDGQDGILRSLDKPLHVARRPAHAK